MLAPFDFDFVWIDGGHGPFGPERLEDLCHTAELVGVTPIARVPDPRRSFSISIGAYRVSLGRTFASRADAEQLVRACSFGPQGERSLGGNRS